MFEGESVATEIAARQYGVLTKQQALGAGMTERQIDHRVLSARWLIVHPGVYRIAGAPLSARQRAIAACFWLGDEAAISHTTAARVLRLDGVGRKTPLHVSAPLDVRRSSLRPRSFSLHRVARFDDDDRITVDGLPCTSPARTLVDLAGVASSESLEIAFESARRLGLVSVNTVASCFTRVGGRGKKGSARVRQLLEHQVAGARALESPLEVKLWRAIRASGLPMPARQVTLRSLSGERYRVDYLWPCRVIAECDGFDAHAGHLRWKRDRRRIADIELLGYSFVHVTWDDVTKRLHDTLLRIELALARGLSTQQHIV